MEKVWIAAHVFDPSSRSQYAARIMAVVLVVFMDMSAPLTGAAFGFGPVGIISFAPNNVQLREGRCAQCLGP
jgi:hypothetical protein